MDRRWGTWTGARVETATRWPSEVERRRSGDDSLRNDALAAYVLAEPDSDAPRGVYADWCHEQGRPDACDFIHGQLALAKALRADPGADPAFVLAKYAHAFAAPSEDIAWWRYPAAAIAPALLAPVWELYTRGLVDDPWFARGFVEHVAVRASRFLQIAGALFAAAPIRHLTLTYVSGGDNYDDSALRSLLESEHVEGIRSLQLPGRIREDGDAVLNRLTTADVIALATSPAFGRLAYIELRDQWCVDAAAVGGIDAMPALRTIRSVRHRYRGRDRDLVEDRVLFGEPVALDATT